MVTHIYLKLDNINKNKVIQLINKNIALGKLKYKV